MAWTKEKRSEYNRLYQIANRERIRANAKYRYKHMSKEQRLKDYNTNREARLSYFREKYHSMTEEQKEARKEYDRKRYLKSKNLTIKQ